VPLFCSRAPSVLEVATRRQDCRAVRQAEVMVVVEAMAAEAAAGEEVVVGAGVSFHEGSLERTRISALRVIGVTRRTSGNYLGCIGSERRVRDIDIRIH
jgi:hypothetical protein